MRREIRRRNTAHQSALWSRSGDASTKIGANTIKTPIAISPALSAGRPSGGQQKQNTALKSADRQGETRRNGTSLRRCAGYAKQSLRRITAARFSAAMNAGIPTMSGIARSTSGSASEGRRNRNRSSLRRRRSFPANQRRPSRRSPKRLRRMG